MKLKAKDTITYYSRVHKKDVEGVVEFAGTDNLVAVTDGVRYSLQSFQVKSSKRSK